MAENHGFIFLQQAKNQVNSWSDFNQVIKILHKKKYLDWRQNALIPKDAESRHRRSYYFGLSKSFEHANAAKI